LKVRVLLILAEQFNQMNAASFSIGHDNLSMLRIDDTQIYYFIATTPIFGSSEELGGAIELTLKRLYLGNKFGNPTDI
jgi:hypothetical protein